VAVVAALKMVRQEMRRPMVERERPVHMDPAAVDFLPMEAQTATVPLR
jgi:hypothetical protein